VTVTGLRPGVDGPRGTQRPAAATTLCYIPAAMPAPNLSPSSGRLSALQRAAGEYVRRAIGCEIDSSEESLAFVDHYLGTVRQGGEVRDEALALIAAAVGVHLGEVAIAKYGGAWRGPLPDEGGDADDPATWRVELAAAPLSFDPVGMTAEALRRGEVEGYDGALRARPDLSGALEGALVRAAPVSDEYYYSLTGRFEAIGYVVDVLGEVLRLKEEQAAPPAAAEDEPS
jgi:hypothetical protein